MIAGLYTFGDNVNGLLLSNYAGTDLDACLVGAEPIRVIHVSRSPNGAKSVTKRSQWCRASWSFGRQSLSQMTGCPAFHAIMDLDPPPAGHASV